MYKKSATGFTLIELLVVIAIIGILTSVVLASVNSARDKGANATIKADLSGMRSQADIIYDDALPHSYDTVCANENIALAGAGATRASGGTFVCNNSNTEWAASIELKIPDGANGFWCVDGSGASKSTANPLGTDTVCT